MRITLLLTLIALFLQGNSGGEVVEIQVLHTADIHGRLTTRTAENTTEAESFLKLGALIEEYRGEFGRDRTLLIDTGDTIQGTWSAAYDRGEAIVQLIDELDYDAWVIGNHEFDYGITRLQEIYSRLHTIILAGNLQLKRDGDTASLPAWRLFKYGDARVVVIGATSGFLRNWFCKEKYEGFKVEKAISMLRRVMPTVFQVEPDMIILAMHQGWQPNDSRGVNEVIDIVREFPEIDLILGGHTHWTVAGRKLGPETWYVQPGKHAEHLGVIRAEIDLDNNSPVDIRSFLEPVTAGTGEHKTGWEKTKAIAAEARDAGSEITGHTKGAISAEGTPGIECQTSALIARAIAHATACDVVLHGKLSEEGLPQGTIKRQDIFPIVPYENGILICRLTREDLKTVIEEQLRANNSSAFSPPWGIEVKVNQAGEVLELSEPEDTDTSRSKFTVALNSYTAAGGGGRFPQLRSILDKPGSKLEDTGLMTRQIVEEYIKEAGTLERIKCRAWIISEESKK